MQIFCSMCWPWGVTFFVVVLGTLPLFSYIECTCVNLNFCLMHCNSFFFSFALLHALWYSGWFFRYIIPVLLAYVHVHGFCWPSVSVALLNIAITMSVCDCAMHNTIPMVVYPHLLLLALCCSLTAWVFCYWQCLHVACISRGSAAVSSAFCFFRFIESLSITGSHSRMLEWLLQFLLGYTMFPGNYSMVKVKRNLFDSLVANTS